MSNKNKFPTLHSGCTSMLCKHLNKDIFEELKNKQTQNGFTISNAINSGVTNIDSGIGVYAGDEESYSLFSSLFDPIIQEYHDFGKIDTHHSNRNAHDLNAPNPDINGEFIVSTRIRVGRNIANFPLGPAISKEQRNQVEKSIKKALNTLDGELQGNYFPLLGMNTEVKNNLIKEHFLFKEGDRFLAAAGLNRDWPSGRGIYHNNDKTFLVWVNEEDQLRIISMQKGGDILKVFIRLMSAIKSIEKIIDFSYNDHIGYITSCPTNLGTALRASVHIALPKLSKSMDKFKMITNKHHLQIRGVDGEHSKSKNGIYDISNRRRLGFTEVMCVQDLYNGVVELIEIEKSL